MQGGDKSHKPPGVGDALQPDQDTSSQEAARISGTDCVAWILPDLVGKAKPRVEWGRSDQGALNADNDVVSFQSVLFLFSFSDNQSIHVFLLAEA